MAYWASHLLFFLFLLFLPTMNGAFPTAASYSPSVEYTNHCSSYVPGSGSVRRTSNAARSFAFYGGSVRDGGSFLRKYDVLAGFAPKAVFVTRETGTLRVDGELILLGSRRTSSLGPTQRSGLLGGKMFIRLSGFWSEKSGMLCMVGIGQRVVVHEGIHHQLSARFLINLPKSSNISTSLVTGLLQSLDGPGTPDHFHPIRVLFYAPNEYQYTFLPQAVVGVDRSRANDTCSLLQTFPSFSIDYGDGCEDRGCGPFYEGYTWPESTPSRPVVSLGGLQCSWDGRVNLYMIFPNSTHVNEGWGESDHPEQYNNLQLHPSTALVMEGVCDDGRCDLTACRVRDSSVDDCTIGITIQFPLVMTVKNRSIVFGEIFSRRNDFQPIRIYDTVGVHPLAASHEELKYKFTMLEEAEGFCSELFSNTGFPSEADGFPDRWSSRELSILAFVGRSDEERIWVQGGVLSIGETITRSFETEAEDATSAMMIEMSQDKWKIGYQIYSGGMVYISAEGYYYSRSGLLCLAGCTNSLDCEVGVAIQIGYSISEWERYVNGTIRSRRAESDPLYFQPLKIGSSSLSTEQPAVKEVTGMDAEVVLVAISTTLLCLLIRKQILFAGKNPQVAASVSITMQVFLALGLAMPLVLGPKSLLLRGRTKHYFFASSLGWIEANEVIMRVTMMVALLLQVRLLHVILSMRSTTTDREDLSTAERRAFQLCLPVYLVGFSMAWTMGTTSSHESPPTMRMHSILVEQSPIWSSVLSISGLMLDGFLLPQIVLNVLTGSKDSPLSEAYYLGTTMIRVAAHLYNVYRARFHASMRQSTFIIDDPTMRMHSIIPDIVIPVLAAVFAGVIWVQQRFGGASIVPKLLRRYCAL